MALLEAILFVLSSGLLFHERFRKNKVLFLLAGVVALGSSYFLLEEMTNRLIQKELQAGYKIQTQAVVPEAPKPPPAPSADTIFWLTIKDASAVSLFEEFVTKFPASQHVAEARGRIAELSKKTKVADPCDLAEAHWKYAERIGTITALEDHIQRFATCAFTGLAKAKISELQGKPEMISKEKDRGASKRANRRCVTFNGREICE